MMKLSILLITIMFFSVFSLKSQNIADSDFDFSKKKFANNLETTDAEIAMTKDSLINYALKYLKTPYRRGTAGTKSFDCSGFSSYVYRQFGYNLFRTSQDQAKNGIEVHKDELQKGDLVFFQGRNAKQKRVGHVGIVYEVLPDGTFLFIHASCKWGVTITNSDKAYYQQRYVTARRIIEEKEKSTDLPQTPELFPMKVKIEPVVF